MVEFEYKKYEELEDGNYPAKLRDIEIRTTDDGREFMRWLFEVETGDGITPVTGVTSSKVSSRSVAGQWITTILGRELQDGEKIKKEDLIDKEVMVVIQKSGRFTNVTTILPKKAKKTK